jgi:uncharacterized caspase-like protein
MSEDASLSEAVRRVAGTSLTEAVKTVARRSVWPTDGAPSNVKDACGSCVGRWAGRVLVGAVRAFGLAAVGLVFLVAASTSFDSEHIMPAADRQAAAGHKRIALVVGISGYRYAPRLANPRNDALDMSATLRQLGYHVIEGVDLDKPAFDRKVLDFAAALKGADVGVFFYAGHGLQVAGQNYLVPVDARPASATSLEREMVRLDAIQRTMEQEAHTNILFVDACRDNPLARALAQAMGTRSVEIGRGLAPAESGVGTLVSFSTQPGNVALDGTGRNSPFSEALVRHLRTSSEDLSGILIAVRKDVVRATERRQVPWEHSALTGRFYFNPVAAFVAAPGMQPGSGEAAAASSAIKHNADLVVLGAFLPRDGESVHAEPARARMEEPKQHANPQMPFPP